MDYVTRQFIVLTKKLRKELRKALSTLHTDFEKQTETIRKAADAADKNRGIPPRIVAETHVPAGIETRKSANDAASDNQYQQWMLILQVITILAIGGYSALVYLQWKEMIGATDAAGNSVFEARRNRIQAEKSLNATIDQFHLDQRAWIQLAVVEMDAPKEDRGPKLSFKFLNSGKTPAREVKTKLDWYPSITTAPPFCKDVPRIHYGAPSIPPQGSYTLHDPSTNPSYVENTGGGIQYWDKGESPGGYFCINGQISYADIFSEARHTTHFCVFAQFSEPQKFAYCHYQNEMN